MTAYAAVYSLMNTIDSIQHASHISLVEPSLELIYLAFKVVEHLKTILEKLDSTSKSKNRKEVNVVDARIRDAIWGFEDLLESSLSQQILSQSQRPLSRVDLLHLIDDIGSFIQTLRGLENDYTSELENMGEDDEEEKEKEKEKEEESTMIGLWDQCEKIKGDLMHENRRKHVYALVGTAGVGKTALAKKIYEDPQIMSHFECRAWVRVGRKHQQSHLSRTMLAQLSGATLGDENTRRQKGARKQILEGKRCLIVVDDLWETQVLNSLMNAIPKTKTRTVLILVTTRDLEVIPNITLMKSSNSYMVVRFLTEEESKNLLCQKVFGDYKLCPYQLDKAAAKIAKKCEGLPLMIVTVAGILLESHDMEDTEPDYDYWDDVAEERNSVFLDAYDKISKVLFPSYDYLPQYLKMLFLFMGVFPPDYATPISKIINMLAAEGWFLDKSRMGYGLEVSARKWLCELWKKSLVLLNQRSIDWRNEMIHYTFLKACWLHSSWRYVCRAEARKNKFYHALSKLDEGFEEVIEGQRSLCLQNNILFGIKLFSDVFVESNYATLTRSLLFFGPYHQYPTSIDAGFRLLRELDALQLRFYTFPIEILMLVQLKYLALTCNGELPTTISKLFNLQILIIHPHMNIQRRRAPSYVPIQIWDMQQLEHIEILGKSFVAPYHVDSLEKLSTLVGVNASISTIFNLSKRIPNIKKLGVKVEVTPYDEHNDLLNCFGCISKHENLKTLKFGIVNPVVKNDVYVVPATPSSFMLPRRLEKLHLSGMGFPWEYMDVIGSIPSITVLKLRSYAFRGSKWVAKERSFSGLQFLLIEDSDLVQWKSEPESFRSLRYLSMKHCYKLEEFEWSWWPECIRMKIELVNCNPKAFAYAEKLEPLPRSCLEVTISSSFEEKPRTIKFQRLVLQLQIHTNPSLNIYLCYY